MRLGDVRQSSNVQDRRAGGGGRRVGIAASGVTLVVVIIVAVVTGKNPLTLLSGGRRAWRSGLEDRRHGGPERPGSGVHPQDPGDDRGHLEGGPAAPRATLRGADPRAVPGRRRQRVWLPRVRSGAFLLSSRQDGLRRSRLLGLAPEEAGGSGRFRRWIRHRARGRAPRAEAVGDLGSGARRRQGQGREWKRGSPRAASRLLRGRLGLPRQAAGAARGR
jgi:hypothetical protein